MDLKWEEEEEEKSQDKERLSPRPLGQLLSTSIAGVRWPSFVGLGEEKP